MVFCTLKYCTLYTRREMLIQKKERKNQLKTLYNINWDAFAKAIWFFGVITFRLNAG